LYLGASLEIILLSCKLNFLFEPHRFIFFAL
jgi:hypothetical protein